MLNSSVVLPTSEYFLDVYDRTEAAFDRMFIRLATAMQVDLSTAVSEFSSRKERVLSH